MHPYSQPLSPPPDRHPLPTATQQQQPQQLQQRQHCLQPQYIVHSIDHYSFVAFYHFMQLYHYISLYSSSITATPLQQQQHACITHSSVMPQNSLQSASFAARLSQCRSSVVAAALRFRGKLRVQYSHNSHQHIHNCASKIKCIQTLSNDDVWHAFFLCCCHNDCLR